MGSCISVNHRRLLAALGALSILLAPLFPLATLAEAPLAADALA